MPAHSWFNNQPEAVGDVPLWINVFGPCTQMGRALGLQVDLPNLVDRAETEAICRLPSDTWKDEFEGGVVDTMRNGDHDWMRLADFPFASAFYDLEEGVKFHTTVADLKETLRFIVSLADKGVKLWDRDYMEDYGGEDGSCVWVCQAILGPVPDAQPEFERVGLVPSGPDGTPPWTLPPGWAVTNRIEAS
jgi:hypothetical protein